LTGSDIHRSYEDRTISYLDGIEAQARARVNDANIEAKPDPPQRLATTRENRDAAEARNIELWKELRASQKRMAIPDRAPSLLKRLLGRKAPSRPSEGFEKEQSDLQAAIIASERTLEAAIAEAARAEKSDVAVRASQLGARKAEIGSANMVLSEVLRARRAMAAFPALAFTGPVFTAWTGQRIERRWRDMRNRQSHTFQGGPIGLS